MCADDGRDGRECAQRTVMNLSSEAAPPPSAHRGRPLDDEKEADRDEGATISGRLDAAARLAARSRVLDVYIGPT